MNRKLSLILMTIASLLSLITVGFASWIITDSDSAESSGMIVVDDVIKVNNYITCSEPTVFKYFKNGFVKDGKIVNYGIIETSLIINIENCKLKFKNYNTLEIDLSLESENLNVFLNTDNIVKSVEVKNDVKTIFSSSFVNEDNTEYLTIFDIENFQAINDELIINVTYTFILEDFNATDNLGSEYFANYIFPQLIKNYCKFALSSKLTGKVVN